VPGEVEYSQGCKLKSAVLLGVEWTRENEMLYITNQGLELYAVAADKRQLKKPVLYNLAINWFVYNVSAARSPGFKKRL
jgi:hypothetical protein